MKKIYFLISALFIILSFSACTLDYEETQESHSEPETSAEEVTEKEALVPLLFEDEENKLYLYGIRPEGVILYANNEGHYYDWTYSIDENHTPKIFTGHFDGDYKDDIAVILFEGDNEYNAEELYFISDGNFDTENVYKVNTTELNSYASYIVDSSFANNAVSFTSDGISYSFDLSESFEKLVFDGISYSDNVEYEFSDGKIYVNIIPVAKSGDEYNDYGRINLDITLRAKLNFDGYNISLSEPTLKPHI